MTDATTIADKLPLTSEEIDSAEEAFRTGDEFGTMRLATPWLIVQAREAIVLQEDHARIAAELERLQGMLRRLGVAIRDFAIGNGTPEDADGEWSERTEAEMAVFAEARRLASNPQEQT